MTRYLWLACPTGFLLGVFVLGSAVMLEGGNLALRENEVKRERERAIEGREGGHTRNEVMGNRSLSSTTAHVWIQNPYASC